MGQCALGREEVEEGEKAPKKFPFPAADGEALDEVGEPSTQGAEHVTEQGREEEESNTQKLVSDGHVNESEDRESIASSAVEERPEEKNLQDEQVHVTKQDLERSVERDAILMLESGAHSVFGWSFVDLDGNEHATWAELVQSQEKRVSNKNKKKNRKKKKADTNAETYQESSKERFQRQSAILCPQNFSWKTPIHYICFHVFEGVSSEQVFRALCDVEQRALWEPAWENARVLHSESQSTHSMFKKETVYSCFPNESKVLRMMGLNYDFVDERVYFKECHFPQAADVLPAYAMAWRASRRPEREIYYALEARTLRFHMPSSTHQVQRRLTETTDAIARFRDAQQVKFQRVQPTPPADFVVIFRPVTDNQVPPRKGFERSHSMPPSGIVVRSWDTAITNPSTSIFSPMQEGKTGVRVALISRSDISLPVNMLSRRRLHLQTMESFLHWRTSLERFFLQQTGS